MLDLLKRPAGFLPLLISAGFLIALLVGLSQGTLVRQPDEGAAAHLFQILMPLQVIIIVAFAAQWIPKRPQPATAVLSLQVAAMIAVVAIVFLRHL
ncbi:MAG: hypothetical protein JO311_06605 [Candidatus Eremiobacteraeota bacterium]|nr:hypothetical protein [Candidatus Eremiobacteraeota bacterium]MBV9262938.1 hypothetical protein [Candidatus Eremiobacteraeota bacterium]